MPVAGVEHAEDALQTAQEVQLQREQLPERDELGHLHSQQPEF